MFKTEQIEGFTYIHSTILPQEVRHCFTTKLPDGSISFDTDHAQNRKELGSLLGFQTDHLYIPHQQHTDHIKVLNDFKMVDTKPYDAIITNQTGLPLLIQTADCVPIIVYDTHNRVLGLIHAGWRGTAKKISFQTVQKMKESFASLTPDFVAIIGPSIGSCCFKTDKTVANLLEQSVSQEWENHQTIISTQKDQYQIDLKKMNGLHLLEAGVKTIDISSDCTCCLSDRIYHSYRGNNQTTLRNATMAQLM